jgi:hypothetical protein
MMECRGTASSHALLRWSQRRRRDGGIDRRASEPIEPTDHRQGIAVAGAGTALPLHPLRLFHSSVKPLFSMRSSASSRRIISSPIFARARISSRSSGSAFVRSPRLPCSRKIRCQRSSSCAALGFPATRHPTPPRAAVASPAPSSVARSGAPAAPPRPGPESVHCPRAFPSGASLSSQPPWLPLIPPLAGEISKEIGSGLVAVS